MCRRCGECCHNGGPALHEADRSLVESGVIHTRYLYTIRKAEYVHDNVLDVIQPAHAEIIKIKGKPGTWECIFLQKKDKQCRIYTQRPLECRVLKCWDTSEIEAVYKEKRLTRQDLLSQVEGLWDLIADHDRHCTYTVINRAVRNLNSDSTESAVIIAEIVEYDNALRQLVVEKGLVSEDMVDFLFGRPLSVTLKAHGLKIKKKDGKVLISKR